MKDPQDPAHFAKKYIGDQTRQSVFHAANDIEEVEALAALLACRKSLGGPECCYGLRILPSDLAGLPATAKHTPKEGDTGIYKVDHRHFDLESDAAGYLELMARLIDRLQAGEHRIRHAGTHQIALMLRTFSGLDANEIGAEKKSQCTRVLKNYNKFGSN